MRPIIILCIILSGEYISQAQLNFEGSPLTENTEYTAQESQLSRRNVEQDYQRFEVADGRIISVTKGPFTHASIDNVAIPVKHQSRTSDDDKTRNQKLVESTTLKGSPLSNDRVPIVEASGSTSNGNISTSASKPNVTKMLERSFVNVPKGSTLLTDVQSPVESRQLHEYPVQSQRLLPYQSAIPRDTFQVYGQSENYAPSDQIPQLKNPETYHSLSSSPETSVQALNEFLNSRTPEESQAALQNYLTIREQAARGIYKYGGVNGIQSNPAAVERNNAQSQRGVVESGSRTLNGYPNDEHLASQLQESVPSNEIQDRTGQSSYLQGQQHVLQRGIHPDLQFRQNVMAGPGRHRPRYRGQMSGKLRGRPWAQSRIDPRPFVYHQKGPVYGGPPGPPAGLAGKWKSPVEVIYTRPPGFGHGPPLHSNPPVPYEDASHWFPDADEPPPQKDVYYSQLYAQSYDPHYYNYIAKTGKIKPWLYGKLGKHEEKSIWWELFAGFKKHGMKNMMNPMFLLGMTIPTLTIMLTALVQKRSLGRSDTGGYITEQMIDEYVQRLQENIACYEKQIKDDDGSKDNKCW